MDEPASLAEAPDLDFRPRASNPDLLVMTVEIGDGRQDTLYVKEEDSPEALAYEFAQKHGLDPVATSLLVDLITQNKEAARRRIPKQSKPFERPSAPSEVDSFKPKVKSRESAAKGSVYDRLYQRKKKPVVEKTRSASVSSRQSGSFNYGEWLYIRGMQSKESLKRAAETKKQAEKVTVEQSLTFHPTINRKSSLLSPRYATRTEDLLLRKEAEKKEKLEMRKLQAEEEKLKECSFTPRINQRSQQLDTSRSSVSTKPRYEDLYQEASKRRERQLERFEDAAKSEFSFRPEVHAAAKVPDPDPESFLNRIVNSKKKFEEEMEKLRQDLVTDTDPVTGQKLFEPAITKDPRFDRHLETSSVHEHLYAQKDHKKQLTEKLAQELDENIKAAQRSTKVTQNSEKLLENFRRKAYENLFNLLDSDRDGVLTSEKVDISALEDKTASILEPVLESILTSESETDFIQFHMLMDQLLEHLPLDAKSHILKRPKGEDSASSGSMMKVTSTQRSLSVRSDMLANKRRESMPGDIYTRRVGEKKITDERLEKMKKDLEKRELQECTFKPFTARLKSRKES